ncbi:MAG: hypothetical protein HY544_05395 [Candidatus Diapherotrites archaeon]|uniref:Uncharacterized protein n=1 Tax=Candidatus Iainarchaeum sp. TaxID=3101447 RepID=A0A8T3YNS6_9ARCH|nr:hypothetical protein [Candidatus Diapherotrites archaeon]
MDGIRPRQYIMLRPMETSIPRGKTANSLCYRFLENCTEVNYPAAETAGHPRTTTTLL